MGFKCPGQDFRNLRAQLIPCPACGYKVEVFSDEITARCPSCSEEFSRDRLPACVDWCAAARECIGPDRWQKMFGKDGPG